MAKLKMSKFDYELPKELIAQQPAEVRDKSRLMVVGEQIENKIFSDIVDYLQEGDVLVLNETRVMPAKLVGEKSTGSPAEVILTKQENKRVFECRIKTKNPGIGTELVFGDLKAKVIRENEDIFDIEFDRSVTKKMLQKKAMLPLPPYITEEVKDYSRYQTIFARKEGAVAAPTAGLHFTGELLEKIKQKGVKIAKVCLHVGFGTFIPIREDDASKHEMESEYYEISPVEAKIINSCKGRLICVGTTSMRALESACDENGKVKKLSGWTDLFIYPGYTFKSKTEAMITNFHLPKSTLLLMVSAFAGRSTIFKAYKKAIKEQYRFYSFGDAMFLFKEYTHPQ
jgi:S-adenosylmethionine:tRNA ribosyltransferase-isomerase